MKISAVIMASGFSKRMGENKLLLKYKGKTFIENITEKVLKCNFYEVVIVTSYREIENIFAEYKKNKHDLLIKKNKNSSFGISESIKTGVKSLKLCDVYMFFTGDQPALEIETIKKIMNKSEKNKIIIPKYQGKNGTPTAFGSDFYGELMNLNGDSGGRQIIRRHREKIEYVEIENLVEGYDIDTPEEYKYFILNN